MYVDTNIIVDFLRDKKESKDFLKNYIGSIKTSIIVKLELIDGLQTKREISNLTKQVFNNLQIEIIQINDDVSKKTEEIFTNYRHSRGISVNDSIIAATALIFGQPLATHNTKHFDFIPNLKLIKPY